MSATGKDTSSTTESFVDIQSGGATGRAGFRLLQADAIAGGPVTIEFVVANTTPATVYFFAAMDSARLRLDGFTIEAGLQGSDATFADPAANVPYLGGPGGPLGVDSGGEQHQRLLVNDFATLEQARDLLEPGASGTLWIRCTRQLSLAATPQLALQGSSPTPVQVTLTVPIHRDDAALDRLAAGLAESIRSDQSTNASADREQSVGQLIALRSPVALPYIQSLKDHPDPTVRMYVERALAQ